MGEAAPHIELLGAVFLVAAVMGAVVNKTNFCAMGAVSDWVNMGDTGRLRAWLLAIAVATAGTVLLEAAGRIGIAAGTFPPYRTANFAWLRYVLGGFLFGVGMTLASGCANRTLVRIGGGNLKSLVVLVIAAVAAYAMLWTDFFAVAFNSWIAATTINLATYRIPNQTLGALVSGDDGAGANLWIGLALAGGLIAFVFSSRDLRASFDNVLSGVVVGLAVVAGWYLTGGALGDAWKDFAAMALTPPSRVQTQSFTFISPLGDALRWLRTPADPWLINFGMVALLGVVVGSLAYALAARRFRIEWFANVEDFVNHAIGGALMGIGGVLAMGCTIGQAVTGVSTLALGSVIAFLSIVAGAAVTMKFQYWRILRAAA